MADELERLRRRAARERSARHQAEAIAERAIADLTEVNRRLDVTVSERTADLEDALHRLAAADQVKSTFLRGVAHEMSTPLHAIRGFLEMIETSDDRAAIRRASKEAGHSAERLHGALRTLVEFASASTGGLTTTVEEMTVGDYAEGLASRWMLGAARRGLLLVVEPVPEPRRTMVIDPVRLDQICDALIDNAVRFARTRIDVTISAADAGIEVVVADDGPGPPEGLGDTIFESFVRGERSDEGFGIGLTLARLVAEAMGGSLDLDSSEGVSSRFVAIFPDGPGVLIRHLDQPLT